MPISLSTFDEELELYFRHASHETVLDIGPGEGKFGKMLRRVQPAARRIGVEVDPAYVERYRLSEIYDEVRVMDARRLMDDVRTSFGAVICGDVIEHLPKSAGTDLLHFLVYRCKVMFVKYPVQALQNDWQGHSSEAHVSVWSALDFAQFDHLFLERHPMQLAVIRGYQNATFEWLPQEFVRALGYDSCAAFYDEQPDRWKRADRHARWQQHAEALLRDMIAPGDRFIMMDQEQSGLLGEWAAWRIPYLERDGFYNGMPADDRVAVDELRRHVRAGAKWLVVTPDVFWALDVYPRLAEELRIRHRCAVRDDQLLVYELQ